MGQYHDQISRHDKDKSLGQEAHLPEPLPRSGGLRTDRNCRSHFEAAIAAGADAFITGEISEPQAHYAREMNVSFIACGHHASERYGAPAVAAHVAAQHGLVHEFMDIDNPA